MHPSSRYACVPFSAVLVFTLACLAGDDPAPSAPMSVVEDSAGIVVVTNRAPAPGSRLGWQVGPPPPLAIGVQEGDERYQLFWVEDAARLPDGRIAVANAGTSEIRFFSDDGTFLESWGGAGEGPGEFPQGDPESVGAWRGDSIVGASWWRGAVSVYDAEGNHGRTALLGDGHYSFAGLMPDGNVLGQPSILIGMPFGTGEQLLHRQEARFALIAPDGELHASLGTHEGDEWFFSPTNPGARPHPFGRTVLATVWGALAVVATNDRYEITAYDGDGRLARIVRRDHELRAPTQAELAAALEAGYAEGSEEDRARLVTMNEGMPLVESYPAFSALQSDPLGYLWVREYDLPGQERNLWTVFDPEGRVEGFVEMPLDFEPSEIGEDYILGLAQDELGVERVQLWGLSRGG